MPINLDGEAGFAGPLNFADPHDEDDAKLDPPASDHPLDVGPEHLRSTPSVKEQAEVEDPEAEAAGGGRTARELIVDHLATCALDDRALPSVELSCEVRRLLLGKDGQEGCPSWAMKLFRFGGSAATHTLPHEMGQALQELAGVFAEAMQTAVDRVRQEAEEQQTRNETSMFDLLNARAPLKAEIGDFVTTLSGLTGLVTNTAPDQWFTAKLDIGPHEDGMEFSYGPTGSLINTETDFPLVERLRLTIASIRHKES